ncbi:MAG: Hpt domain-containing protein, partial [Synergistaceae bacterium]|jgi:HPt (histidine-containing phosphotransfer) domain-containing protein|nr:Hpt domain-containing protein [Synergistaceae bacterium]
MDGIEAAAAIRSLGGHYKKLLIVALTANAVSGMRKMFLENGFDDFLSKPIEIPKLGEMLERWVPAERRGKAAKAEGRTETGFTRIDGLDTAKGMALTGGSPANYRSVLALYCRDAETRIAFLDLPNAEADLKNFSTQVHALKSASASIGAVEISQEAALLEDAGRRGDMEAISERVSDFRESLVSMVQRIQTALDAFRELPSDGKEGVYLYSGSDEILSRLRLLKEVLAVGDVGAADKLLAELGALRLDKETSAALSDISDLVLISEFREAEKMLGELIS